MGTVSAVITFGRGRRPADYESLEGRVELTQHFDEGHEVAQEEIEAKFDVLRAAVYNAIGLKDPGRASGAAAAKAEDAKPARKRRTKAEIEADKKAKEEAMAEDKIGKEPEAPAPAPEKSEADDLAAMIGGAPEPEAPPPPAEIKDAELQTATGQAARETQNPGVLKQFIAAHGVALVGEIPQAKRQAYLDGLEKLTAAVKAGKADEFLKNFKPA